MNPLRASHSLFLGALLWSGGFALCAHAAESPSHADGAALRPIAETVHGLDLNRLAALPVQHGGRYKPLHSFAMEMMDAINGSSTLGAGHTPLTSLLDLLFCHAAYLDQPIVTVKHGELCRDLAQALPENERARLIKDGRITPRRLSDEAVQTALENLSRQTAKTKAINQVRRAHATLDSGNLVNQLRLYPVPAGPHSDRWRDPAEFAGDFAAALGDFLRLARATRAEDSLDRFAQLAWSVLPLSPETASRLRLSPDDQQHLNHDVLWPLWQAAAAAKLDDAAIATLAAAPGNNPPDSLAGQAVVVVEGLAVLRAAWPKLGLADDDLARADERPALDAAITRACSAWNALGAGWAAARSGGDAGKLQTLIDAFTTAAGTLRVLDDGDRAARGEAPLRLDTDLELTYWKFKGFSGVAWLFLFAVPLLALGAIGRQRLALRLGYALFGLGLAGQIAAFVVRGILAQRIPLANLYESMAAASLLCSLVALSAEVVLMLRARNSAARGALALGASLFGCIVVLAQVFLEYHDINAFISPAMPILSEFWLRVHTSCVVSSYGLIALGGLMSLTYLFMRIGLRWDDPRSLAWDRATFAINAMATVVLWVGLSLGAVWAAVSWGRPWGWDPKEVFALLTWVVFIILVHLRLAVSPQRRGLATAWVSLSAFAVMIFNWYIVNVVLAGLHSYA